MEQKQSSAWIVVVSIIIGLTCSLGAVAGYGVCAACADEDQTPSADTTGVYETTMAPWSLSPHANDGSLSDYDAAYRKFYRADQVKPSRGHWGSNDETHMAADDDSFWETNASGSCSLDFTFGEPIEFTTMVYGSRLDASRKGYATVFEVYTAQDDSDTWKLIARGNGASTDQLCSFTVCDPGRSVKAKRVRFTFVESSQSWPSCRTMRFYARDPHAHTLDQIWGDYAKTTFAAGFDAARVRELCNRLKQVPGYESVYKPLVERAEAIISHTLAYDPTLERSNQAHVAADERTSDVMGRWGDVAGYARQTLKFPNNTTNRQSTGLWYRSGETIHVWVSRENPADPLPLIHWAQPYGYWASWHGGVTQLGEGENILIVPNFKTVAYKTYDIVAGCAAYLENPYTEQEQTGEVKVYFEGAHTYPVYRLGDDVNAYMEQLRLHADKIRADRTSDLDVTELVSGHAMMTVRATQADYLYGARGHNAEQSLRVWQDTLERVYAFEGIEFDPTKPNYDPKNVHLNENYRVSQVWDLGWMFTAGEHIGVYTGDEAENVLIDALDEHGQSRIGGNWGLIHEFGHSIDIPDRTIQETTNNMAANYVATRDAGFIRNQADIDRANAMADPDYVTGTQFNTNRYNFMPFFLVESYWPGWWGRLENLYRDPKVYTDEVQKLPKTERLVYLASLAAGYDLGYWFEKWGLNIDAANEKPFARAAASSVFSKLMNDAHFNQKIDPTDEIEGVDGDLPLWYLDAKEFNFITDNGLGGALAYDDEDVPTIKRVSANGSGYTVTVNAMEGAGDRHLLFEIQGRPADSGDEAWSFLGTTYGGAFSDDTDWKGAEPEYRVRAIDRALHHSSYSEPSGLTQSSGVALVGTVPYDTLVAAIEAAQATEQHQVTVVKDCVAPTMEVTSDLTIKAVTGVNIACSGATPAFKVVDKAHLTIEGASTESPLVFDGEHSKTAKAAIVLEGSATLTIQNGRFTGWDSKDQGAAIAITSSSARAQISSTVFDDNHALDGAALANRGTLTVTDCTFTGNTADDEGGALRNHSGGVVTITDCRFTNNQAVHGGAISVDGFTAINGGELAGNTGTYGGAIEQRINGNPGSRVLALDGSDSGPLTIHDNEGLVGAGLCMARSGNAFLADVSLTESNGDAIWLDSGHLTLNATKDAVGRLMPSLVASGGLLSTFGDDGASESTSTINGVIHNVNGTCTAEGAWPAGVHRYALSDWGREGAVVELEGFDGAADWTEHVITEGEAVPRLMYQAAQEDAAACVRPVFGGKLTFHLDGGEIKAGVIEGYTAGAVTYLPTEVTKSGYSFVGWFDNEKLEGASVRSVAADQEGDKEFWAKWSTGIYWINYRPNNGTMPKDVAVHRTLGETVKLAEPTRESFEFLGWYENPEFKSTPLSVIEADSREGDITVYARWTHGKDKGTVVEAEEPSCTAPGYTITIYKCVDCSEEMASETTEIPALGHQFGEWKTVNVVASCGTDFYQERKCEVCGFVETKGVANDGHQWGDWIETKPATCTTDGMRKRVCERCQAMQTEAIERSHQFGPATKDEESAVEATCELPGHYDLVATCEQCGLTSIIDHKEIPARDHAFTEMTVTQPNDCTKAQGEVATRQCETCGLIESQTKECVHRWEASPRTDRAATCTSPGVTSIHCADCGAQKDRVETPALNHDFSDPQSATCLRCSEPNPTYRPSSDEQASGGLFGDSDNENSGRLRAIEPQGREPEGGDENLSGPADENNETPKEGARESTDTQVGDGSGTTDAGEATGATGDETNAVDANVGASSPNGDGLGLEVMTAEDVACSPELASLPAGAEVASQGVVLAQTGDGRAALLIGLAVIALLSGGVIIVGLTTHIRQRHRLRKRRSV